MQDNDRMESHSNDDWAMTGLSGSTIIKLSSWCLLLDAIIALDLSLHAVSSVCSPLLGQCTHRPTHSRSTAAAAVHINYVCIIRELHLHVSRTDMRTCKQHTLPAVAANIGHEPCAPLSSSMVYMVHSRTLIWRTS